MTRLLTSSEAIANHVPRTATRTELLRQLRQVAPGADLTTHIRIIDRLYADPANAYVRFDLAVRYASLLLEGAPEGELKAVLADYRRLSRP